MPVKKFEHTNDVATRFLSEVNKLRKLHPDTLAKIGIAASYVSQIRNGKRFPTVDHLVNLCREYKYSGTWLLTGTGMMMSEPENRSLEARLSEVENRLSQLEMDRNTGLKKGHKHS
jgi:transcriptional regulator with XRE-family HTH domain